LLETGLSGRLLEQRGRGVEAVTSRVVDVEVLPALGEHGVREVRHSHRHVAVSEVDPRDRSGGAVERDQHGRAADDAFSGLGGGLALDDESGALEVGHHGRDRRARQRRRTGELRAAGDAALGERLDHAPPVGVAQRRQCRSRPPPHSARGRFHAAGSLSRLWRNYPSRSPCFVRTGPNRA
jgi:hypothetical protein